MVKSTCSVDGCGGVTRTRGWCNKHYTRWRNHGDPLTTLMPTNGEPMAFLKSVVANPPDRCVVWPYGLSKGYAQIRLNGRQVNAHRVALELFAGPPPNEGMEAAHAPVICHNRACINPLHSRWATRSENQADRVADGTANRGTRSGSAKLTEAQVFAIRSDERSMRRIAADYGVAASCVSNIKNYKTWVWLK